MALTLEEATAKIVALEAATVTDKATIATLNTAAGTEAAKIIALNNENAERRVLNNQQKKSLYAAQHVIAKNNIKVDYDKLGADGLTLNATTGQVEGEVTYDPASVATVGAGIVPASVGAPEGLSIESIQSMSRADIAKNWEAVQSAIENQPTT